MAKARRSSFWTAVVVAAITGIVGPILVLEWQDRKNVRMSDGRLLKPGQPSEADEGESPRAKTSGPRRGRSVAIKTESEADSPDSVTKPNPTSIAITSEPSGVEIFIDWKMIGVTPVRVPRDQLKGLLVAVQGGYRAHVSDLGLSELMTDLALRMQPDTSLRDTKMLLLVSEGPESITTAIRRGLMVAHLTVAGPEEGAQFLREQRRAGSRSNRGLQEWARARFGTNYLLAGEAIVSTRELGQNDMGYEVAREQIKGLVRAEVAMTLELVDLRNGEQIGTSHVTAASFGFTAVEAVGKALADAGRAGGKDVRKQLP